MPIGVTAPADVPWAYSSDETANQMSVIDKKTVTVFDTIPMGPRPHHLMADEDGHFIYVGQYGSNHYCPVIAWANRCNLLTGIEIDANSRRDDIFSAPVFPSKIVARNAARQNAACWLAAPSSLS
jgi:YVTN family beta-propeller protein